MVDQEYRCSPTVSKMYVHANPLFINWWYVLTEVFRSYTTSRYQCTYGYISTTMELVPIYLPITQILVLVLAIVDSETVRPDIMVLGTLEKLIGIPAGLLVMKYSKRTVHQPRNPPRIQPDNLEP
jgi:hypothetical protein